MKITTTQATGAEALRAVADGKQVQMIWDCEGRAHFSDFTEEIENTMRIGKAWLIVEIEDDEPECIGEFEPDGIEREVEFNGEPLPAAPDVVVTDPDATPITVEIPNSQKDRKERWRKIDDDLIASLKDDGLTERQIAERMDVSQVTIHNHIQKMKKEAGR